MCGNAVGGLVIGKDMDIRFKTPFTYICAGASRSGKTVHVRNLLKSCEQLFTRVPDYIIYFYAQWQPIFSDIHKDYFQPQCCPTNSTKPTPRESYEVQELPEKWGGGDGGDDSKKVRWQPPPQQEGRPPARPLVNEWVNQLPTTEMLREKLAPFSANNGSLIIVDDFVQRLTKDIGELFTVITIKFLVFVQLQSFIHSLILRCRSPLMP